MKEVRWWRGLAAVGRRGSRLGGGDLVSEVSEGILAEEGQVQEEIEEEEKEQDTEEEEELEEISTKEELEQEKLEEAKEGQKKMLDQWIFEEAVGLIEEALMEDVRLFSEWLGGDVGDVAGEGDDHDEGDDETEEDYEEDSRPILARFFDPDSEGDMEDDLEESGSEEDPNDPYSSSRAWRDRLW